MSTYLSPIVSSGDSTPVEQQVGACGNQTTTATGDNTVEYPTRELRVLPASETQTKQRVSGGRKPAPVLKSQKSIRSMGNSMMLDDDSSESDSPASDAGSDLDEDRSLSQIQRNRLRYMAQNQQQQKKVNIFSQQPEQVGGKNQCLADKFLAASQQQQAHNTTNIPNASSVSVGAAPADAASRPKRHSSSASSSSSLINCSDGENSRSNRNNHRQQQQQQSGHLFGAAGARKKFKQILQSIPMVPLVATTSLMTILILCAVLLLTSDSLPIRVTAKLHRARDASGRAANLEQLATELAGGGQDPPQGPQMQSLVMGGGGGGDGTPEVDEIGLENLVRQQDSPARVADLKRELIDDLLAQQRPAFIRAAALRQRGHLRAPLSSAAAAVMVDPQAQRPKSKRGPERANVADQTGGSGGETAGLFDSLGSMLFGAQQTRSLASPGADEQELAGAGREPDDEAEREGAYLDGGPAAVVDGSRPAYLRSSALELELPESGDPGQRALDYQPQQMRARSTLSSSHGNKQHAATTTAGRHNNQQNQHAAAAGQQQRPSPSQQQQQQSVASGGNHERPFDVAQIQCNNTEEGFERFACPTSDLFGRYKCIEDRLFCDGYYDCPGREDEDQVSCMYYRLFVSHIDILTNTFLTWMKSQNRQANGGGGGGGSANSHQQQSHHHHRQTTHMTTNGLDLGSSM